MKELIPMDDMGIFVSEIKEEVLVDSRMVAEFFEKQHKHVLRDIETLVAVDKRDVGEPNSGLAYKGTTEFPAEETEAGMVCYELEEEEA